jgi:hypothetical protein
MEQQETILDAAVAKGMLYLDAESANREVARLLRQVGDLESRNVALENGIAAVSRMCGWRQTGACWLTCEGRGFCDTKGLAIVTPGGADNQSETIATDAHYEELKERLTNCVCAFAQEVGGISFYDLQGLLGEGEVYSALSRSHVIFSSRQSGQKDSHGQGY